VKHHVRALHSFAPPSRDHFSALRVCAGLAVPSLALLMFGHPELVIYALFGAMTGMYGGTEPHQLRLQPQLQAAGMLVTGVMIGTGLSVSGLHSWWLVGVETLLAGVGSLVADRLNFKPSGPFFGILALGACASIPTTVPWLFAVLIGVASAATSISVGFLGWIRERAWRPNGTRNTAALAGPRKQRAFIHAGRYVLAVGTAGAAGVLTGSAYPHWAMAAAAVPLAAAYLAGGIYRGIHRVVGTFLGLVIVAVLLLPSPWQLDAQRDAPALVIAIIFFQFTTELLMMRHYGLAMVSFTPVILLVTQLAAHADPYVLLSERGVETLIGAIVGIIVLIISGHDGHERHAISRGEGHPLSSGSYQTEARLPER
jgi:hypothetical protein